VYISAVPKKPVNKLIFLNDLKILKRYLLDSFMSSLSDTAALPSVTLDNEVSVNYTSATTSLPITFCRALSHLVLDKEKSLSRCHVTVMEPLPSACWTRLDKEGLC
jgi:hypothetical protein